MKRRGRPFNHTAECAAKQADFRQRLREMKMLSADEGTPALDPGSGEVKPLAKLFDSSCAYSRREVGVQSSE